MPLTLLKPEAATSTRLFDPRNWRHSAPTGCVFALDLNVMDG